MERAPRQHVPADVAHALQVANHHGVAVTRVALVAERVAELVQQRAELLRLVQRDAVAARVELRAAQHHARVHQTRGQPLARARGRRLDPALGLGGRGERGVVGREGDLDLRRLRLDEAQPERLLPGA